MAGLRSPEWRRLPMSLAELCINTTLRCGQSFRWRKSEDDIWSCTLHGRILSLKQDDSHLHYRAIFPTIAPPTPSSSASLSEDDTPALIHHYFNLSPNLTELYEEWSAADKNFKKRAPKFTGVRILKQDAWEALIGFICSSNNNIARISQMVEKLCIHYGPLVGHLDDQPYYDFPPPSALTGPGVEQHLRELGFGYRAKYIQRTAVMVAEERPAGWLDSLRNPENPAFGINTKKKSAGKWAPEGREGYRAAHEELIELQGVGPKVADCVCLFGLAWSESVPVDTHVWQIAQRDYKFGKSKHSSLTKASYDGIGAHFRGLWGKEAGWAHSVLFTADLKTFSERLTVKVEKVEKVEKIEGDVKFEVKTEVKTETVVVGRSVKRELEEGEEKPILEIEEIALETRSIRKRRKRT